MKLINKILVKFDCCKGEKIVAKWWKIKGTFNFIEQIFIRGERGGIYYLHNRRNHLIFPSLFLFYAYFTFFKTISTILNTFLLLVWLYFITSNLNMPL